MRDHLEIRECSYDYIVRNFVGPYAGGEETLERRSPHDVYLTGALYPMAIRKAGSRNEQGDFEVVDGEGHLNSSEEAAAAAKDAPEEVVLFPSSAGISFRVKKDVKKLLGNISFGTYQGVMIDGKQAFQRKAHSFPVDISASKSESIWLIPDWVELRIKVRELEETKVITVTLLNRAKKENFGADVKTWMFKSVGTLWQVEVKVAEERAGDLMPISPIPRVTSNREINSNFLLYRGLLPFASGHNCSADWTKVDGKTVLTSKFIPLYLLRMMVPAVISGVELKIENFTSVEALRSKGVLALNALIKSYKEWAKGLRDEVDSLETDALKRIAKDHLAEVERASERIQQGLALIERDENVAWCVSLANRVMELQRGKSAKPFIWHPFQFAFFLLNLSGIVDPKSSDRGVADLLWFPTGGGKTEAYLLISAFTIAWRRIAGRKAGAGAGTAILLRYTLRLLTQQQLQRAAKMICAMESLRSASIDKLGDQKISIGLWVGGDSFPNSVKDWEQKKAEGRVPMPFESCPSCGVPLQGRNYLARHKKVGRLSISRLEVICDQNEKCSFYKKALPIHLTDEDVYQFSPTMLVGTVDKFANLAWKEDTCKLFNKYAHRCIEHGVFFDNEERCKCSQSVSETPPELIIQDELHLISGPLGSMVGAFECAIRFICTRDGVEPKYITSTATIRGADRQLFDLYHKKSFQFPPSGFDAGDNFFAKAVEKGDDKRTRAYVGISAQGRSPKLIMARLYGLLSHFYQELRTDTANTNQYALDNFRTVVGYFNARRELGGVKTMLGDDVPKWRKFHHGLDVSSYDVEHPLDVTELMGSVDSKQLMKDLERVGKDSHTAPEFVLATNILSVGIDIDRLSLMVVAGQPKTASEYIQASSRVGRSGPGIVIVSYNWARARDRSHYEKFRSFHEQIYRYVEGISVTPFSPEARRRTLAGVFVAVARHSIKELRGDEDAIHFDRHQGQMTAFKDYYLQSIVDPEERADSQREIEKFLTNWRRSADNKATPLRYKAGDKARGVLGILGEQRDNCLDYFVTSLRNVDEEVPVQLTGRTYGNL